VVLGVGALVLFLQAVGVYLVLAAIALVILAALRPDVAARISGSGALGWLPLWMRQTPMRLGMTLVLVFGLATAAANGVTPGGSTSASPLGLVGGASATPRATQLETARPSATVRPTRPPPRRQRHSVALFAHGPTGPRQRALVTRVIDGDTIEVAINGRLYHVRYIGMDTPEVYFGVEWMGPEASAANRRLVDGKRVVLEKDVSETDRYGRLLRFVWIHRADGWLFVNAELLREGYAQVTTYPPDVKYADTVFLRMQRLAREHNRGLWSD
jgi:endonuclease YncB( thermonuclease family)